MRTLADEPLGTERAPLAGAPTAAGLGAALLVSGVGFASPSLLVAGVGLCGLALVAVAWVGMATPKRLERAAGPSRIVEGEPYPLRVRAYGARVGPPAGELTDSVLATPVAVGPRWSGDHEQGAVFSGRGLRRLAPARLEIRDPLGLRVKVIESKDPGELLVLPRIEPVLAVGQGAGGLRGSAIAGLEEGSAASRLDARAIELEIDGLRPYRDGSPASRIHWPTVARTGELVERRLIAGGDAAPLVAVDATRPRSEAALDAAVRAAASLCSHLAERGGCAVLLPGDRRPTEIEADMRAWPQVHARLALVAGGGRPPAALKALRSGAVFWVTAQERPSLPPPLRSGGTGKRYLVTPLPDHTVPASGAFMVAGCEGRLVGARVGRTMRSAA